jgi:TRAP-type C4-dicarboxylate transport system permease small subunit
MAEERGQPPGRAPDPVDQGPGAGEVAASLGEDTTTELLPAREPIRTILHATGIGEQVIGTSVIVLVLVLVLAQVGQRYTPGGWPWTGEVARLSMVWATFMMSGYLMAHDRHIAIHVVDYVLKGRALAVVKLLVHVVVLATCLVFMYATYDLIANDIGQVTAAAEIPLSWVYVIPLVGFLLTTVRAVVGIVVADVPSLLGREGAATWT